MLPLLNNLLTWIKSRKRKLILKYLWKIKISNSFKIERDSKISKKLKIPIFWEKERFSPRYTRSYLLQKQKECKLIFLAY